MYINFDNQLLSLYLSQRIRRSIPIITILLIIITYFIAKTIRNNQTSGLTTSTTTTPTTSTTSTSSSISYTFLGPTLPCSDWSRLYNENGYRADTISSDAISDTLGDWYFADSITSIQLQNSKVNDVGDINLNFRFRKLSVLGVEVSSSLLFGQPPPLYSNINFTTLQNTLPNIQDINNSSSITQRLFVVMAVHEPSSTTIVLQNGLYNATYQLPPYSTVNIKNFALPTSQNNLQGPINNGIFFSTIALHSNIDGFCLWLGSYNDEERC